MVPQSPRAPPSRATIVTASQTRCTPTLAPVISVGSAPLLSSHYGGIVPNVSVQQTLRSTTAASSTAPTVTTVMSNQSWPRNRMGAVPSTLSFLSAPQPNDWGSLASANQIGSVSDAATRSLLEIQTQSHAYTLLTQKRPRHKYTGDHAHVDFESFLHKCESLMNVAGATASMKLAELPNWFSGTAGLVVDRFVGEPDAEQALADAFKALKKEFGRKRLTARQMLTEQLQGEKISEKSYTLIKTFLLNLERIHKVAKETKREESFNLPEVINEIIRTKLPHLAGKWAKKVSEVDVDDEPTTVSFLAFLSFAKKQNTISQAMGEILKNPEPSRPSHTLRVAANHVDTVSYAQRLRETCTFCPGAAHQTNECRKFSALSKEEKARTVREKRLCTSCLGHTSATHKAINCATKKGCSICGERHHTLLHGIPFRDLILGKTSKPSI